MATGSDNQIRGTVIYIGNTEQVTDTFKKRTLVVKTDDNYPQEIKMQVTQNNVGLLDKCRIGNTVNALYNLYGKPYQRKDGSTDWNLNLNIWKLDIMDNFGSNSASTPAPGPTVEDEVPF